MSKPTIPQVRPLFAAYHARQPAWGVLHVVLDDGNVDNASVRLCLSAAEDTGDAEAAGLARLLLCMSKTQRAKIGRIA